ncbi:MAG: hypothetical protein JW780_05510 [Clostridiales bacterium]|nr:hypothetical protein [Clostridiales bacterium]
MTQKPILPFLALLLVSVMLSSCLETESRETQGRPGDTAASSTIAETVDSTRESTIDPTTSAATETTETTESTEATENIETTQTVPPEVSIEAVFLEGDELQMGCRYSSYLKNDESAWVFDQDVRDGLLAGVVFTRTELPIGTVVLDLNDIRPEPEVYPGKTIFLLSDGRCVFFEQSTTEDGAPVYNGKAKAEFFGVADWNPDTDPVDVMAVRDHELLPNTPPDPSIRPQNITVKVDWNQDGKVDTIKREIADMSAPWDQVIRYTDGATGKTTDITGRFEREYLSDHVMLISGGSDDRPALIDRYDVVGSDNEIFIYTYDPINIVSCEVIYNAAFAYEDGEMFIDTVSFLFGDLSDHRIPVMFDGKTLQSDPDFREIWWKEALRAKKEGGFSRYFTYTLTEVPIEKKTSGGFVEDVIPVGVAVFPQFYYWDDENVGITGYVQFLLADGTECRKAFEYDTEYDSYWFGNDPQWELFYTYRNT